MDDVNFYFGLLMGLCGGFLLGITVLMALASWSVRNEL
jgi:hypothetical protein